MYTKNSSRMRRRLQAALIGTSLGLFATTGVAQENDGGNDRGIGGAISDAIGNQIRGTSPGQGSLDPAQRGVGETLRGVIEGQDFGDAVERGVGESARTLGETPYQTRQRDWEDAGRPGYAPGAYGDAYSDPRFRDNRIYPNQYGGQLDASGQGRVVTRINTDGQPYQVRISGNQGARLGISMQQNDQGIVVSNVTRGSAAAQAGLRPGDVLMDLDGQRVVNTRQVADLIGQRSPGDDLNLVVMRDGERQELSATLQGPEQGQMQRMARPELGDADQFQQMQQQIQELQRQVQELQQQLRTLQPGSASAEGNADIEADIDAASPDAPAATDTTRIEGGADIDAELRTRSNARPDASTVPDLDLPEVSTDVEADAEAGAELGLED